MHIQTLIPPALRHSARPRLRRALRQAVDAVPRLARARDARHLRRRMCERLGYEPDLENPRTFNEKVAWKILFDRNPLITLTSDKIAVRDYVAAKVGPEILVPLLGVYASAAEINWDELPDRFVLKASHGSGMNQIIRDKARADRAAIQRQADLWLTQSHYEWTGEWGYRDISPRLLTEPFLEGPDGAVPEDFKFHVVSGRTRLLEVHLGRFGTHQCTFYDTEFRFLPVRQNLPNNPDYVLPPRVRDMVPLAARLGEDFDYVRVDLYLVEGRIWFGELTHYNGNASEPFDPPEYDLIFGEQLWA